MKKKVKERVSILFQRECKSLLWATYIFELNVHLQWIQFFFNFPSSVFFIINSVKDRKQHRKREKLKSFPFTLYMLSLYYSNVKIMSCKYSCISFIATGVGSLPKVLICILKILNKTALLKYARKFSAMQFQIKL